MTENKNILIIDDIRSHLLYMKWILGEDSYNVSIAEDLKEAYNLMQQKKFDLILLDLIMPNVDGFAFLKKASATPEIRDIPIIVVSVKNDLKSIEKSLSLGARDYIVKPYNIQDLKNKAAILLNENKVSKY
jgi:response regulator RpfG family c-di-GMP phosphodiesterase